MAQAELEVGAKPGEAPRPRLYRSRDGRLVGGVAAGLARHIGVDPLPVRAAFVGFAFLAGFGVVVYGLLWILAPLEVASEPMRSPGALRRPRTGWLLGAALLVGGVIFLLWSIGLWFGTGLAWPVVIAAVGFAILWARDPEAAGRRIGLGRLGSPVDAVLERRVSVARVAAGALLILGGMAILLAATTSLEAATSVVFAVLVTAGGLALLAGPWIWGMAQQLIEERSSRIRSEERAEMAAHLHDSVLQTLALIQRAKEPREMVSLARTQERELRAWLYTRSPSVGGVRLRDAIDAMAGRIEARHHARVEAVVVGDAALDEPLRALVAACSEATLNAAVHSGATQVSLYVEVEPHGVTAFIRDQGGGFEPDGVSDDRRGIRESIVARMERHGGSAEVHSRPGSGTEVVLRLPRRG